MQATEMMSWVQAGPGRLSALVTVAVGAIGLATLGCHGTGKGASEDLALQDAAADAQIVAVRARPVVISTATRTPRTTTWSVNYWMWTPTWGDDVAGTESLVRALAPAVMRIGGYNNDANTPDPFDDAQLDRAVAYARAIGAEPLIQVPVLRDTAGKPPTAATAAAMVTYANVTRGYAIKYFSIGNEPDLYATQGSLSDPLQPVLPGYLPSDYCASARAFVTAMKGVDPTIQIVGPDLAWHYQSYADWLTPILQGCGDLFDIIAVHRYPFSASRATLDNARNDVAAFRSTMTSVRGLMQAAGYGQKPLALTEMNVAYDATPAGTMPAAAPGTVPSALWLADVVGSSFRSNLWTSAVWAISDPDEWSLGIIGLPPAHTPRPQYYAYRIYADHFGPTLVDVLAAPAGVSAYASRNRSDDGTEAVLINWNAASVPVTIVVTDLPTTPLAPTYVLPPLSISAVEVLDQRGAAAWTYGDAQHAAGLGPQPLPPTSGIIDDAGEAPVASDGGAGLDAASGCKSVVLPGPAITTLGKPSGATLFYGTAPNSWGSFTYAASGQPMPTAAVTPGGNGIHITAQFVAPNAANNYEGVGLYFNSASCVDGSPYTGVQFDLSGDLGACSLALGVQPSGDLSTADDPTRGACPPNPSSCYGPYVGVSPGPGTTTLRVPFAALGGGMPTDKLDATSIVSVVWELSAPLGGADGGGCTADFTVENAAFY